jgi:hypothetical protein
VSTTKFFISIRPVDPICRSQIFHFTSLRVSPVLVSAKYDNSVLSSKSSDKFLLLAVAQPVSTQTDLSPT